MSTSFDFSTMISGLGTMAGKVQAQLKALGSGQSVDLTTMFTLQFQMQMLAQYVEATSATLTAVHGQMMSMAKAVKGQ